MLNLTHNPPLKSLGNASTYFVINYYYTTLLVLTSLIIVLRTKQAQRCFFLRSYHEDYERGYVEACDINVCFMSKTCQEVCL